MFNKLFLYCALAASLFVAENYCVAQDSSDQQHVDLRVMSFNIRYGAANDGENRWENRRQNVITTIAEFDPDLLGTQEVLSFQAEYLQEHLTDYTYVGRSREDRKKGEQCGILVRTQKFDILEQGHFWLSETPNVPGSESWDTSLPRMASWVKLSHRESKKSVYFVNTHFDHRGKTAREESAKVIAAKVKTFEEGIPVVLAGDFNTRPDSAPYNVLAESFTDTFDSLHPDAEEAGTTSGFRGVKTGGRIDFIFSSTELEVLSAEIDHREFDGRNPSDHFPVTSVLRLR